MKATIIAVTERAKSTTKKIQEVVNGDVFYPNNITDDQTNRRICDIISQRWNKGETIIFVSALGICVRSIAPLIQNKHTDPAVICVDTTGKVVIPVLSGHVGGANQIAKDIALAIQATAIITTQSDNMNLWSLDLIAEKFGWTIGNEDINPQIALFVAQKPTALLLDICDNGTEWLENNLPNHVKTFYRADEIDFKNFSLLIVVSPFILRDAPLPMVHYIPKCVYVGIGLAHQAHPTSEIISEMFDILEQKRIYKQAIKGFATITEKRNEPVIRDLERKGYEMRFFTSNELKDIPVPSPSNIVEKYMGTTSVSEAAAMRASSCGKLILKKTKGFKKDMPAQWTMAASIEKNYMRQGMIEIIGAGPGAQDLISIRAKNILLRADLVLYAGSLVPKEICDIASSKAIVRSSADMTLEEQVQLIRQHYIKGHLIARLHTGDPCLYGAIEEQMNLFDKYKMDYRITPGISAFQVAAAELRSQFTIPKGTQTVILTRCQGRTAVPECEKLHNLARANATMCIYLSGDLVEEVEKELLKELPSDTPTAICYRLTWPQQRITICQLKDLAHTLRKQATTLHTLIVVGKAIGNRSGVSDLYNNQFSHLYRKASQ